MPLTSVRSYAPALPIPDESSAGVTSTVAVSSPGLVRDLNVTLGGLTHSWVGDLVIELTSPQGTTVRLVQHPGGPDNGGDNFVNTTFDDEAPTNVSTASAPYTGSFRPQNDQLSRFDGEQRQGTWTLRVRDLFESDAGTLTSWQATTSRAICDSGDQAPPDTAITAGPSGPTASRAASFSFAASEGQANFLCSLDGGPFADCGTPYRLDGLAEGPHTLQVQARDAADKLDLSPAERSWTVDTIAPAVSLSTPRAGASFEDAQPQLAGSAGMAPGDSGDVVVKLWRGTLAAGLPAQTLTVPRAAGGAWSTRPAALADGGLDRPGGAGRRGRQRRRLAEHDLLGRLRPRDGARLRDRARRVRSLRCQARQADGTGRVRIRVPGDRGASQPRPASGTARPGKRECGGGAIQADQGEADPHGADSASAGPLLTRQPSVSRWTAPARPSGLNQTLVLRKIDLRRVAGRGLTFTGRCSRSCSIGANLLMKPDEARRHGIRTPGGKPVAVAGATSKRATTSKLVLRLSRSSRKPLLGARRANVTMEARVSASTGPSHRTSYGLTLRG